MSDEIPPYIGNSKPLNITNDNQTNPSSRQGNIHSSFISQKSNSLSKVIDSLLRPN